MEIIASPVAMQRWSEDARRRSADAGIDLHLDGRDGLKYEFIVQAGTDPSRIILRFDGQDGLDLKNGRLVVKTTAGTVIEEAPVSYQTESPSSEHAVPSAYALSNGRVHFKFTDGVRKALPLVIDPTLTFGSYTGSQANNFGFTATYDHDGALYGGGIDRPPRQR